MYHSRYGIEIVLIAAFLYGCGSGDGGSSTSALPQPSFTIAVNPPSGAVAPGTESLLQVSVQPQNGFNSAVSVSFTGLATGLSVQPAGFMLTPSGPPQSVTLTAASSVAPGNYMATVQGLGGGQTVVNSVILQVGELATFQLNEPVYREVVARFGGSVQFQIQSQVCCAPAIGNYLLNFAASGLPANVTASFSPNPIVAGGSTTLNLSSAPPFQELQNSPFTVTATASAQVPFRELNLFVDVSPPVGSLPNNRTDFISTDFTPTAGVYDSAHQLIYASNFLWNRVDVISPVTKQIVRRIPIPNPLGLDLSLDGSQVYVSTQSRQIFAIDTTSLAAKRWYLPTTPRISFLIGQNYGVLQPIVLSNGKLLLLGNETYTLGTVIIEWDPATNTVTPFELPPTFQVGGLVRSGDGSKVLIWSNVEPGGVALYDTASNTIVAQRSFGGFIQAICANPTGTRFVLVDDLGLDLYDGQLNPLGIIPPGFTSTGALFSSDGAFIYVIDVAGGVPAIFTVDASTLKVIGTAPAYSSSLLGFPLAFDEAPFAVDSTKMIFGIADHGIALDDAAFFQALGSPASAPFFANFIQPPAGPLNMATPVTVTTAPFDMVPDVWFGNQRGINTSVVAGRLQVSAPPATQPGPVNVKILEPNGVQIFDPLDFSYGPAPLFFSGDAGSPFGGALADIIALGVPNDPSAIQVSVGGTSATVLGTQNIGLTFPTVDIQIKLPAGTPGLGDVTVTTSAGAATLPKAYQIVPSITDYPSPDTFEFILYDRSRDQVYLAAGDHVDVFSVQNHQLIAPIMLPSAGGKKQFAGMALTPDGSKLIVSNLLDGSVDIVNPDNPSSATPVPIAPAVNVAQIPPPCYVGPEYVATTNTNQVFVLYGGVPGVGCGVGGGPVYQLDLSTLAVSSPLLGNCGQTSISSTRDGSKVAFGGSGFCIYDSATNTYTPGGSIQPLWAAAAGDANVFAAGFRMTDPQGNLLNTMTFPDVYYPSSDEVLGAPSGNGIVTANVAKINDSGSLMYVPFQNSVDIFDIPHAILRRRVTLSEQIPMVLDALAIDPQGQNVFLITSAGLTVVTLGDAPLSIGNISPTLASTGTTIFIRGSGFVAGTVVTLNGQMATATFVDSDTLNVKVPSLPSGPVHVVLTNPDGQTYTLDDPFTVQ